MQLAQPPNVYTRRWFAAFLGRVDPTIIAKEMLFLERVLPRHEFRQVLDVCCGVGRHAIFLARAGHSVIALDRSESALEAFGSLIRGPVEQQMPDVVLGDMRALPVRPSTLDAIINMWQSFGQFDAKANREVLAEWARGLRPGGRLVMDLYHRAYHEQATGTRRIVRDDVDITEVRSVERARLQVTLTYAGASPYDAATSDQFEWQLYSPEELASEAAKVGLELERVCTEFDETRLPTNESPRMQLVFVRAA
jgi:SAM-dependent methyltransferase